MNFKNFQQNAWHDLFANTIYKVFSDKNFTFNNTTIVFAPANANAFLQTDDSKPRTLKVAISVGKDDPVNDMSATLTRNLVELPIYTANGIVINSSKWSLINVTNRASGWYIERDKRDKYTLSLNRGAHAVLTFKQDTTTDAIQVIFHDDSTRKIALPVFLKAVSCNPLLSFTDIEKIFFDCPQILASFSMCESEPTTADAASQVLECLSMRKTKFKYADSIGELRKRLENNELRIGRERIPRFTNFTSFARAKQSGVVLAEDTKVFDRTLPAGEALSNEFVFLLDTDPSVKSINVTKDNRIYKVDRMTITEAITFEEICCALRIYSQKLDGLGRIDDPDEQYNKIIHSVREEYEDYISAALNKYVDVIYKALVNNSNKDPMDILTSLDLEKHMTKLETILSQVSNESRFQQLDDTNSLSLYDQQYKITNSTQQVPASARDIHNLQYNRVCPYTTPESKQVGLNLSLSMFSSVDEYGFITAPAIPFNNGILGSEPVYASAIDELHMVIAPATIDLVALWNEHAEDRGYLVPNCRVNGEIHAAHLAEITHQFIADAQSIGFLLANVPSANRNAGKRLIMSAAAQRQALPVWGADRPLVTTGADAYMDIGIEKAGTIMQEHLQSLGISEDVGKDTRLYLKSTRAHNNRNTLTVELMFEFKGKSYYITRVLDSCSSTIKGAFKYKRVANPTHRDDLGRYYSVDDVVFHNNDIDTREASFSKSDVKIGRLTYDADSMKNHGVAIGENVKVMFKSFEGYTYEDSIVVNKNFLIRHGLTVVKTSTLKYTISKEQVLQYDPSSNIGYQPQLGTDGLPVSGYYVQTGQPILSVMTTTEDDAGRKIQRYSARILEVGQSGFVISHSIHKDAAGTQTIRIHLGEILPIAIGDKLEGLHGNKGVIGRICREDEMPYTEDGETPDIILNTLGILARLNLGQIIEAALGAVASKTGKIEILEPFANAPIEEIAAHAEENGIIEKVIYDGRTGLKFDKKGLIGNMYMLRLEHTSTSKYNATNNCSSKINARTMQPGSGAGGGQRMSEMCTWCLESYNAKDTLHTLFTAQSDSLAAKSALDGAIRRGQKTDIQYVSNNLDMLKAYFYMLGCNIAIDKDMRLELLTQEFIDMIAPAKCNINRLLMGGRPQEILHDNSLYGEKGSNNCDIYAQLPFNCNMIMPIYLKNSMVCNLFMYFKYDNYGNIVVSRNLGSVDTVDSIIRGEKYIAEWVTEHTSEDVKTYFKDTFGIDLPDAYTVPVIANRNKSTELTSLDQIGIRGVIAIFSRCKVLYSLCLADGSSDSGISAENFSNLESILLFAENYELSDFIVNSMIIPPPIYRPISDKDNKMSNPIDSKLTTIVGSIRYLLSTLSDQDRANKETMLYLQLLKATKTKDTENPSFIQQLTDHKHKIAIMRDTLLAKRMSYTGRSVISIGPELELGECGVPICMLETIFEEHILAKLQSANSNYIIYATAEVLSEKSKSRTTRDFCKHAIKNIANNNFTGFSNLVLQNFTNVSEEMLKEIAEHSGIIDLSISSITELFDLCYCELKEILAELLSTHPVLLNREPSLHKFSIQGFKAKPVDSHALQLHPLNCHGFNADYDGDQMACLVPMHEAGIRDTYDKMMSNNNLIDPKDGKGVVVLNQDMILGLYYATMHKDNQRSADPQAPTAAIYELKPYPDGSYFQVPIGKSYGVASTIMDDLVVGKLHCQDMIICAFNGRYYRAEAGKIIINALLPNGLGFTSSQDGETGFCKLAIPYQLNKSMIKNAEAICIEYFDQFPSGHDENGDTLAAAYDRFMSAGFKFADLSGITLSIFDFVRLPIKSLISEELQNTERNVNMHEEWYNMGFASESSHSSAIIDQWSNTTSELQNSIKKQFNSGNAFDRSSNIFMIIDSGARGDVRQLLEISGLIGIVANSSGKRMDTPIRASYIDGLPAADFFMNAYSARRQTVAAQLTTAQAGEFTRKCIYLNEHIGVRDTDENCDAAGTWIPIDYEIILQQEIPEGSHIVIEPDEVQSIRDEVFGNVQMGAVFDYYNKEAYLEFCNKIHKLMLSKVYSSDFAHLLTLYSQQFFIIKTATGEYECINVEYKMTDQSRSMLLFRVIDMEAFSRNTETSCYATDPSWKTKSMHPFGNKPNSIYDAETNPEGDLVIGEELLRAIEIAGLRAIPIYTILGCKSHKGVCRRCFGVKYDTRRFPNFGESIGYQGVQAIGNPITQIILDSHKLGYSNKKSAKEKLDELLDNNRYPEPVTSEIAKGLPFSLKQTTLRVNLVKDEKASSSKYIAELVDDQNQVISTCTFQSLSDLKLRPDSTVTAGEPILEVDYKDYGKWLTCAGGVRVSLDLWQLLCNCFDTEDILARNFEIFARSLTEFGRAEETSLEDGIVKGSIYTTTKLQTAGIDYSPAFLGTEHALRRSGKIFAGVAYGDIGAHLCDAVVRGVINNPLSNIGDSLVGNYPGAKHRLVSHSVVGFTAASKVEYTTENGYDEQIELTSTSEERTEPSSIEELFDSTIDGSLSDLDDVSGTDYFGGN